MSEEIKKEIKKLDDIDTKSDSTISAITGKEKLLTQTFITDVENLLLKINELPENKADKYRSLLLNEISLVTEENIVIKQMNFSEKIELWEEEITEYQIIIKEFQSIEQTFEKNEIFISMDLYIDNYISQLTQNKLPIEIISSRLEIIFNTGEESKKSEEYLMSERAQIIKIFAFYCNGNPEKADEITIEIFENIKFIKNLEKFKKEADLESLPDAHANLLLKTLADNKIDQEQAIKYLNKLKELHKTNPNQIDDEFLSYIDFNNMNLNQEVLVHFLVKAILSYRYAEKSNDAKSMKRLAIILEIENKTSRKEKIGRAHV